MRFLLTASFVLIFIVGFLFVIVEVSESSSAGLNTAEKQVGVAKNSAEAVAQYGHEPGVSLLEDSGDPSVNTRAGKKDASDKSLPPFRDFFLDGGVAGVIDAAKSGEFDVSQLNERERQTLTRLVVRSSRVELSDFLMYFELQKDAVAFAISRRPESVRSEVSAVTLDKMQLLSEYGYPLDATLDMYGGVNSFDLGVLFGMPEVIQFLADKGVQPSSHLRIWEHCFSSAYCAPDVAMTLLGLGYFPTNEQKNAVSGGDITVGNQSLLEWLKTQSW